MSFSIRFCWGTTELISGSEQEESNWPPDKKALVLAFVPEIRGMSSGSIPLPCIPLHSEKIKSICTLFSKLAEAMGKKKKETGMFGIRSAMCSSSAAVSKNLCGILELAKGVGTMEKLMYLIV